MSKAQLVLRSRKFWATWIGVVLLAVLWWFAGVEPETVATLAAVLVGVYTGSVALEDGLQTLGRSLAELLGQRAESEQEPMFHALPYEDDETGQ